MFCEQSLTQPLPALRPPHPRDTNAPSPSVHGRNEVVPYELLLAALDEMVHGLVLLDAEGVVCWANRKALRHLQRPGTLMLDRQRLVADSAEDALALQRALAAACHGRRAMAKVGRGEAATMLAMVPLSMPAVVGSRPCALLVLSRRDYCEPLSLQFFASAHQLTPAEAAVLDALSRGRAPSQVAALGRVELSTVRTQISAVRQKTGARSIGHLLRIVAGLPPLVSTVEAGEEAGRVHSAGSGDLRADRREAWHDLPPSCGCVGGLGSTQSSLGN